MPPTPSSCQSVSVFARALGAAIVMMAGLSSTPTKAQTLDCGQPLCVDIINAPTRVPSGSVVTFTVAYRFQEGTYSNGIDIDIDSPNYFVANHIPTNDTWGPYLTVPPSTTPTLCVIESANPWNVRCGVRDDGPIVVTNNVNNGVFTVTMYSQGFDTPDEYLADFAVTIRGDRTFGGATTTVTHTTHEFISVYGEANPNAAAESGYSQYAFPAGEPDLESKRGRSEGLITAYYRGIVWVQDWNNPAGPPIRVQKWDIGPYLRNRIVRPSALNSFPWNNSITYDPATGAVGGDGNLYDPALMDDDHFDTIFSHPTSGTAGSNALHNLTIRFTLPNWVHFLGVTQTLVSASAFPTVTKPAYGAPGGLVSGVLSYPLGQSAPISQALYANTDGLYTRSTILGHTGVEFAIPCGADLSAIDADRTTPGTQLAAGLGLFKVELSGIEKKWVPDPLNPGQYIVEDILHTVQFADYNPLSGTTINDCPPITIQGHPNNGKDSTLPWYDKMTPTRRQFGYGMTFHSLANQLAGYGDLAIVDYLPPWVEARAVSTWTGNTGGTTTADTVLGAPWVCVLPRPSLIRPTYTGLCPDWTQSTPNNPANVFPWNTTGVECWRGAPYDHAYNPSEYIDPRDFDMQIPFDPANDGSDPQDPPGLGWNSTLRQGCLRASEICDHLTTWRDYGTCELDATRKAFAHEITAVIWRSDGADTSTVNGWPAGTGTVLGEPTAPSPLSLSFGVWSTSLDDPEHPVPNQTNPNLVWTLNSARLFGASFDPDGAGPLGTQTLSNGTVTVPNATGGTTNLTYQHTVYHRIRIDERWTINTAVGPNRTVDRGAVTTIGIQAHLSNIAGTVAESPYRSGITATVDLPFGIDPTAGATMVGPMQYVTVVVPPNPTGLTAGTTLATAVSMLPTAFYPQPLETVAASDILATLAWVGSPTDPNAGFWRYTFTLRDGLMTRGWRINSVGPTNYAGINIAVTPRSDYPFANMVPNTVTLYATVDTFDRYTDNNFTTWPTDTGDFVTSTSTISVPMSASVQLVTEPTCVPGRTAPSFLVRYRNSGGVDQYGVQAVFQIPETADGLPVAFAGVYDELAWRPPGATLASATFEVATNTRDGLQQDPMPNWTPLSTYTGDYADVKLVRLRYDDTVSVANRLPAWYQDARYRVDLVTPTATIADIGRPFTTIGYIGTFQAGATVIPLSNSLPSEPFLLGQCPGWLQVTKFHDDDQNGTLDNGNIVLPGWQMDLVVDPGSSLADSALVDNDPKTALTETDGVATFDVWPGQIPTLTEFLPAPTDFPIDGYADSVATLVWSVTTTPGQVETLPMIGFDDLTETDFGNTCTCSESNLCVDTACVVAVQNGTVAATCDSTYTGPPTCDEPDFCEVGTGSCDPDSGQCSYAWQPCAPEADVATRIYTVVNDAAGQPIGSIICDYDATGPDGPVITCQTETDSEGNEVLRIDAALVCGGGNP